MGLIHPLKPYYHPEKGTIDLGYPIAAYGEAIGGMEGFSRVLWGLVSYWAGGGDDTTLLPTYIEGLTNGTDPTSPHYWGDLGNKDQRMVEMAAISYGILMIPEKLWQPLADTAKDNLANWLAQIND